MYFFQMNRFVAILMLIAGTAMADISHKPSSSSTSGSNMGSQVSMP